MGAGIRALRKIQLAHEVTPGSQITTATARLIGTLGMKNDQKYYRPDDLETGRLSSYERSIIVGEQAALPFASDANFEQLGYLLGMSIIGGVSGGTPADSIYTWTYAPNLTAANAPDTYTIQYGDDVQAFISGFCFATGIELSGTLDDVLKVKADIIGQNVRTATFTGSISPPAALTPVVFGTGKLYVDPSWVTLGNTNLAATLVDLSYKTIGGPTPVKYADGQIYFSDRAEKKRHIELSLTAAFNSTIAGYYAAFIASPQTSKFIRLKFTGPLVGATAHDELDLDGNFIIDDFDTLDERDGQDIVKLKLVSQFDTTSSKEFQIINKTSVGTLP
jgi:hypothetical protein